MPGTNLETDPANCGRCGNACAAGSKCKAGRCGDVMQLAPGLSFACVLVDDGKGSNPPTGKVKCWGDDATLALGGPPPSDAGADVEHCGASGLPCRYEPADVPGLDEVTSVAAGSGFACAIRAGKVLCWGTNHNGELGHAPGADGDTTCVNRASNVVECNGTPTEVEGLDGIPVVAISAGNNVACALSAGTNQSKIYCWGANGNGQRGTDDAGVAASAVPGNNYKSVAVGLGGARVCARQDDNGGISRCWGSATGSLGAPIDGGSSSTPVTALVDEGGAAFSGVDEVVTQFQASCAARNKEVWCWGNQTFGTLGADLPDGSVYPHKVQGLPQIARLTRANAFVCAQTLDGSIWCWGGNDDGTLGRGNTDGDDAGGCGAGRTCMTLPAAIPAFDAIDVAAGGIGMALRADGTVWTWGPNGAGQCGHSPGTNGDNPGGACPTTLCAPTPRPVIGIE